jgi:transcriptional regulator with XRE-family HTH domain
MPNAPDNHDAHDYAERIRERLPRRLQELRERCGLSKYGLARESGLSREYIGKLAAIRRLSRSFTKMKTLGC